MATYNGREASVKVGTYTVAELASWDLDLSNAEIDTGVFGTTWGKSDVGGRKWNVTVAGFYDPTDTTGQNAIEDAWAGGTLVSTIRLYVDNTSYWVPDTTTVTASGGRVTAYRIGQSFQGVASINFTLSGSGAITFV